MHIQVGTYAMPCSVQEVNAVLPHGITGKGIYLRAACPLGEFGQRQSDVSFQHQRVIQFF